MVKVKGKMKLKIFISSVQKEFAEERRLLADYIRKDALLGVFFDVFLFEEVEACEYHPDNVDFKVIIWRNPARLGPVGAQLGRSQGAVRAQLGRSLHGRNVLSCW